MQTYLYALADYGCNGCNGGMASRAFSYIKDAGGVDTEDSYPYNGQSGACRFSWENVGATVKGFSTLRQGDEKKLKAAVTSVGPVSPRTIFF